MFSRNGRLCSATGQERAPGKGGTVWEGRRGGGGGGGPEELLKLLNIADRENNSSQ